MQIIQQPSSYPKFKKPIKVAVKHSELQHNTPQEELRNKEWATSIQKEVDQFEKTLHSVEAQFKEAATSQHLVSLGHLKAVQDEYEFVAFKLQHLRDLLKKFEDERSNYHTQKLKLKTLLKVETKSQEQNEEIERLTRDQQKFKYTITKFREQTQLQYSIAHRVLALIEVYIKLKEQYENQHELQRHRDYILQKIAKIKKAEEKHNKKLDHYYQKINVDDANAEEMEIEEELSEDEPLQTEGEQARQDLINLCNSLGGYLSKLEIKEEVYRVNHDLVTFQQFDQIKVAAPLHSDKIAIAIELIKARRQFYENAPESEFIRKVIQKEAQQQQKLDLNDEKDFPKLS